MFVDASAIVAILLDEEGSDNLSKRLAGATDVFTSPLAVFEVVSALSRSKRQPIESLMTDVDEFLEVVGIRVVPIPPEAGRAALRASAAYGKGSGHPARLNLGDCFGYAMAKQTGRAIALQGRRLRPDRSRLSGERVNLSPQQDAALLAVAGWLRKGHAAGVQAVRLRRHRQDDARLADRGRGGRGRAVRRLHRQGGAGHAQQGLRERADDPLADLPAARRKGGEGHRRDAAGLLAQPHEPGRQGLARHRRRVLDGGRGAGPRSAVVRHAGSGVGRSGAVAAGHRGAAGSSRSTSRTSC